MIRNYTSTRILIAEDSSTQRAEITFVLEEQGFQVIAATNGREALEMAIASPPDLVISDVVMPEMTGFELCRAIRKEANLRHLPVILVTSLSSPTDVFLGLESGADNFITKPYDEKYLLSRIDYILANRELRKSRKLQIGIEIELAGERHFITAERQQILDLLISTYEQAVRLNEEVQQGQQLLSRSYDTLNALFRVAEGMGMCQSEEEIGQHVLRWAVQIPGITTGRIMLRLELGRIAMIDSRNLAAGFRQLPDVAAGCQCRDRILSGKTWTTDVVDDCTGWPEFFDDGPVPSQHASVPLIVEDETVGVLNLMGDEGLTFTESELQTMTTIGRQIAIAFERVRLTRDLEAKVAIRTEELESEISERQAAEVAARLAESRLRDAIESIDQAFTLYDEEDRLVLFNEKARVLHPHLEDHLVTGRTFEEIHRINVASGAVPDAIGREEEAISTRMAIHRRADGEPMEIRRADGCWVLTTERRTSDGAIVCTRTDITSLKNIQNDLAARARRQIALTELGQKALERTSLDELLSKACELLRELLDVPFAKVLSLCPDGSGRFCMRAGAGWDESMIGQVVALSGNESLAGFAAQSEAPVVVEDWTRETRFDMPDMLREQCIKCGATVPISGATGIYGVLGIDSDTERAFSEEDVSFLRSTAHAIGSAVRNIQHEEGQRQVNEHISGILDSSPTAIVTLDSDQNVLTWNAAAEEIFGYASEEVIGGNYPIVPANGSAAFSELFEKVRSGQTLRNVEVLQTKKGGGDVNVRLFGKPMYDSMGTFRAAIFSHEDMTERRKVEMQLRQAQKMEAIGNLTGGIAHDFNNLLAVIAGNVELLTESLAEGSDERDLASSALAAAFRGSDLTRQLLAFSRRQELEPRVTDVNDLITGMTKLLARTIGENVEIRLGLADSVWPAMIDPSQLDSALINLSVNARDAMPDGGILMYSTRNVNADEISWGSKIDVTPGNYVVVEVTDTGTGMAPEIVERIFEPFYTTKAPDKGTGLGLAMVYGFINQSGGHISVYSEVGHGTTFRLYLPRVVESNEADKSSGGGTDPVHTTGDETLLVVEDNPAVRRTVVRYLKRLGYAVLEAGSGREALICLEREPNIDLVFSDIVMAGGISGQKLAETIAEKWPHTKVLLTSGYPELAVKSRHEVSVEILSKPYRQVELARKLREVLSS